MDPIVKPGGMPGVNPGAVENVGDGENGMGGLSGGMCCMLKICD